MLYVCVVWAIIGVEFCEEIGSWLSAAAPHCASLGHLPACWALYVGCMCIPSLSLLW